MQEGTIVRKGPSWYLIYRHDVIVDGMRVRKQKMEWLAHVSPRYARKSDLKDLAQEKLDRVKEAAKCPGSAADFIAYVEGKYLPFVKEAKRASTCAAYQTYFRTYIKPYVAGKSLRDFQLATVVEILNAATRDRSLGEATARKVSSVLAAIFTYAIKQGDYPARTPLDNPAHMADVPAFAKAPKETQASTAEEVRGMLEALRDLPLERAAVAVIAFTGVRPGEARGVRWQDWDRKKEQLQVRQSVWHTITGDTKTKQSVRPCTVAPMLKGILLDQWEAEGRPIDGYILAGRGSGLPVILDNLAKRTMRDRLNAAKVPWKGWYGLRRFHGTAVRAESNLEIMSKALGNSKEVANKHYDKNEDVLPEVRQAVLKATAKLTG